MRAAILLGLLVAAAACDRRAKRGERCANDAECALGALCDDGRCADRARVEKARLEEVRGEVLRAKETVEAAGMRAEQAGDALEADRTPPDAGGGGVRSVGRAEKAGLRVEVHREDYQRNAAGERP
jgi:hypothetical protein